MWEYPCENCLVKPACKDRCYKVFEFLNATADWFAYAIPTVDQIKEYRLSVPPEVLHIVSDLVKENKRFAYPVYIKAAWDVKIDAGYHRATLQKIKE